MGSNNIIEEIEKRLMFSCNVMENEHCINWLTDNIADEDNKHEMLFQPNVEIFREIFGQHQFSFKIDKEYFVWRLQKGADKIYCISHPEGTFYEIYYAAGKRRFVDDVEIGKRTIEFLDYVLDRLITMTH